MPKWKNPNLVQVANEVNKLQESMPGQLVLSGAFLDPDLGLGYSGIPGGGARVSGLEPLLDPPLIYLELEGSDLLWGVQPGKDSVLEWIPEGAKTAQKVFPVPRSAWPEDIKRKQERIEQGSPIKSLLPEALTRRDLIDPILEKADWNGKRIKREVTFYFDPERKAERFRADYVLYVDHPRHSQSTAAIIEAKRESFPADYGMEQGKIYADILAENVRFVFATNGREFVQHDRTTGITGAPEPIENFPRFDTLRGLVHKIPENLWRIDKEAYTLERFVSNTKLDGNDAAMVEAIAKLLLPKDDLRLRCFTAFADSITYAHGLGTGKWETTLTGSGQLIRLNVGRLEVMAIFRDGVHIILDESKLTQAQFYEIGKYGLFSHSSVYKSVPNSIGCDFRAESVDKVLPMIREAHLSLLTLAANSVRENTGYKKYHSPGVIDFLRKLTNRKIPHPIYS